MEYVAEAVHQIIHIATLIAFKNCAELGGGQLKNVYCSLPFLKLKNVLTKQNIVLRKQNLKDR